MDQTASPLPAGAWRSEGYGRLLIVGPATARIIDELEGRLLANQTIPAGELAALIGAPDAPAEPGAASVTTRLGASQYRWLRADGPLADPQPASADPAENAAFFWQTFAEHYAFFALRGVDWALAGERLRARVAAAGAGADLFPLLADELAPLNDGHVTLTDGERTFASGRIAAAAADPDGLVPRGRVLQGALIEYLASAASPLRSGPAAAASDRLWHGMLPGGMGYLAVTQMGGFAADDEAGLAGELAALAAGLDQALAAMAGAGGMIIDLRYNPGGDDALGLALANRFADARRPAFSKQAWWRGGLAQRYDVLLEPAAGPRFDGPVAVLIGPLTTSAAEATALAFRALPRARLIGAPTRGILSDALEKRLPNGWEFTLSNEIYRSPGGECFEGAGVPPHVPTGAAPPASVDERFGRDIRAAAALLAGLID